MAIEDINMSLSYAAEEKKNRLSDLKGILEKGFKSYEKIILSEFLKQLFEKRGYAPERSMKYLKELSIMMNFEIDKKNNWIKKET